MDYIRISASYLFNIELDGKFLLVKSERRNQYQPVGGCYKYFTETESFLSSIGAIPEKQSSGVDSLMDLRLLIPKQSVQEFQDWFVSEEGRETTFDRELYEELISLLAEDKQLLFGNINTDKQMQGSFDIVYDEEKNIETIKPMDIISIKLSFQQQQAVRDFLRSNESGFILATEEDILKGYKVCKNGEKVKIGNHTKNILTKPQQGLVF